MVDIRGYVLSTVATAILCSIVQSLCTEKTITGRIIKLILRTMILIVLVSPWIDLDLADITPYMDSLNAEASAMTQQGVMASEDSMRTLIMEKTQAYILDKAVNMGLDLDIQVTLSESSPPLPQQIILVGDCSPLDRQRFTEKLTAELGLEKENMVWK